jgi:hypothetical protein
MNPEKSKADEVMLEEEISEKQFSLLKLRKETFLKFSKYGLSYLAQAYANPCAIQYLCCQETYIFITVRH